MSAVSICVQLIGVPAAAGVVCLCTPRRQRGFCEAIALVVAAAALPAAILLAVPVLTHPGTVGQFSWLSRWFRLDGLSAGVLVAVALLTLPGVVYSIGYMHGHERRGQYYAYLLWTLSACFAGVLANDLLLLLVCWGILGLTLYLLIGVAGPSAAAAAKKTFIVVGGADCLLLLGVALVWALTGSTTMDGPALDLSAGTGAIPAMALSAFFCIVAAAFAKAGVVPLHTWLPDCATAAPLPVTSLLPGALDKLLGIYLLARAVTGLFHLSRTASSVLMFFGAVTIVLAVMMALVQHDMKRLLSYHAVSQAGYMVLGVGTGLPIGIAGGLFHMLNNSIYKSCLFLCAGTVQKETGTTDLGKLGGLVRVMPWTFAVCLVCSLSISGVPPFNGFASKWLVYQGIIETARHGSNLWWLWLTAAMFGSALTLASFMKILHAVFFCPRSPDMPRDAVRETRVTLRIPMLFLAALCVVFGVFAYRLPLRYLIGPAVGGLPVLPGLWSAGLAAALLIVALLLGVAAYRFVSAKRVRECPPYIGGEVLEESYVSGLPPGSPEVSRGIHVTGTEFYRTIQEMSPFKGLYAGAQKGFFDLYEMGKRFLFYFVEALRSAHTGRLPTYLTWMLAGLLVLLAFLAGGT